MKLKYVIAALCLFMFVFFIGCHTSPNQTDEIYNKTSDTEPLIETFKIKTEGSFSQEECHSRDLSEKAIMIGSKFCGHCKIAQPIFEEACNEMEIDPLILDISIAEDRLKMESFGIQVQYTPTFIFGCDYYTGSKSKEVYLQLLENLKGAEE